MSGSSEQSIRELARQAVEAEPAEAVDLLRELFEAVRHGGPGAAASGATEMDQARVGAPLDEQRNRALLSLRRLAHPEPAKPVPARWRLPALPLFPLYGLTNSWDGTRRLTIWNVADGNRTADTIDPAAYHNVDLGHGDPLSPFWGGPYVTIRNLPTQPLTNAGPYRERFPGELASDAAFQALFMLDSSAHVDPPDGEDRHAWWTQRVATHELHSRDLHAAPWSTAEILVDDQLIAFQVSYLDSAWCATAVLKATRLAIAGADVPLASIALRQIDIAEYYGDDVPRRA